MASFPFSLECASYDSNVFSGENDDPIHKENSSATSYIPPTPFPSFSYETHFSSMKTLPQYNPAIHLLAKAKQTPARQKVPMSMRKSKIISLVSSFRQLLRGIESKRAALSSEVSLPLELFGLNDKTVLLKNLFVALESPPGTGKSVQLPIILSSIDSLKKMRVLSVTCFSSHDDFHEEHIRCNAAEASASKIRSFSLECEEFVSAATFESYSQISQSTRIVVVTSEVFSAMLLTAIAQQMRLLSELMNSSPITPFEDSFQNIGVISFDYFSDEGMKTQSTLSLLTLIKAFYSIRFQVYIAAAVRAVFLPFVLPQCIFACETSLAASALDRFFLTNLNSSYGFKVSHELIPCSNAALLSEGLLESFARFSSSEVVNIIDEESLKVETSRKSQCITLVKGLDVPVAWLYTKSTDRSLLKDTLDNVMFRSYQQKMVELFSDSGSIATLVCEAVTRLHTTSISKSLILLSTTDECFSVREALLNSAVTVVLIDDSQSSRSYCETLLSSLQLISESEKGNFVILCTPQAIPAVGSFFPSIYSRNEKSTCFDVVLNFSRTFKHWMIKCCMYPIVTKEGYSFTPFVDFSSLSNSEKQQATGQGSQAISALTAFSREAHLDVVKTSFKLGLRDDVVSGVRQIFYESELDQSLVERGLIYMRSLQDMIKDCSDTNTQLDWEKRPNNCSIDSVVDPVAASQRPVGLSLIGLFCVRFALLKGPLSNAFRPLDEGKQSLLNQAFSFQHCSPSAVKTIEAASRFPIVDASTAEGQIGAVIGSSNAVLLESVAPTRCRGWLSPLSFCWRNSPMARGVLPHASGNPCPVFAISPSGDHASAKFQLAQHSAMRLYQHVAVNEEDTFNPNSSHPAVTPEEGISSLLAPLVGTGTISSASPESRASLLMRKVVISLKPTCPYSLLCRRRVGGVDELPSMSAYTASYLMKLRQICFRAINVFLTKGAVFKDLDAFLKPLLPTDQLETGKMGFRSRRTRRGATSKEENPIQQRVNIDLVSPYTPLIRFTSHVLLPETLSTVLTHPFFSSGPPITNAVLLGDYIVNRCFSEKSERPYAVLRRSLCEVYSYMNAYCSSALSSLWLAVPSLYVATSPIESAQKLAQNPQTEGSSEVCVPFSIVGVKGRSGYYPRKNVYTYIEDVTAAGVRRYQNLQVYRTRFGEWYTRNALRTFLLFRCVAVSKHFSKERDDEIFAIMDTIMDSENVSAIASLIEIQLSVWMGVFLPGNDEDVSSLEESITWVPDSVQPSNSENSVQTEIQVLIDRHREVIYPKFWATRHASDGFIIGRKATQEALDIDSGLKLCVVDDTRSLTAAPLHFVVSSVSSYFNGIPIAFMSAMREAVASHSGTTMMSLVSIGDLSGFLCRKAGRTTASILSSLRLFYTRQQHLAGSFGLLKTVVDGNSRSHCDSFLEGSALFQRSSFLLGAAGISLQAVLPEGSEMSLQQLSDFLAEIQRGVVLPSNFSTRKETHDAIPTTLKLLALARSIFKVGSFRTMLELDGGRCCNFFKKGNTLAILERIATTGSAGSTSNSALGNETDGTSAYSYTGVEPPLSIKNTIIHVAHEIAKFCGNDHQQRRDMERRLATKHDFLIDPCVSNSTSQGSQYHSYYLYQLRLAAPSMTWIGDNDDAELYEFLTSIENEVVAELRESEKATAPQDPPPEKKQRAEQQSMVLSMRERHHIGGPTADDFQIEEQMPDVVAIGNDISSSGTLETVTQKTEDVGSLSGQHTSADLHNSQSENEILMSKLMEQADLPLTNAPTFTGLLDGFEKTMFHTNTQQPVSPPLFESVPSESHPLSVPPPPIPIDPTADRKYSVLVYPIPDVRGYVESQRDENGEAPHINLPQSLAMALGAALDKTVGPTYLVGNVARIDVPTRGLEQRAIQMGAFMCLGSKLRIIPNTHIFDNPLLAHERGRGRGGFRGGSGYRGRGNAAPDEVAGRGRGSHRVLADSQLGGGSLLPLPLYSPPMSAPFGNFGIADN